MHDNRAQLTPPFNVHQPELAPLTFVAPVAGQPDTASTVLAESIKKRKMGRPPRAEGGLMEPQESTSAVAEDGGEAEGQLVASEEVVKLLDEIEPDPEWLVPLPPEFRATDWGQAPYVEALVGK